MRLRDEVEREREERNFFQLERDKISTFWEITKKQLDEVKAELRNKDREIEEVEERHAVEIKVRALEIDNSVCASSLLARQVYKQKVKHLLYEHQNQTTELKSDRMLAAVGFIGGSARNTVVGRQM